MGYQNSHRNFVMFYWLITLSGFCVKVLNLPWLNHPSSWIHPLRSLSRVAEQYLLEISEDVEKWGCKDKIRSDYPKSNVLVLSCTILYLDVLRAFLWKGKLSDYSTRCFIFGLVLACTSVAGYVQSSMRLGWILALVFIHLHETWLNHTLW